MRSPVSHPRRRSLAGIVAAALLTLLLPFSASAHSELKASDPAEGASVPSPFSGPMVLTFSEALADGSKADLVGPDGSTAAAAIIDATAATMTFSLSAPLAPGAYQVKWTSIADDGDLLRGTVAFSIGASATAEVATPAASPASSNAGGGGSGSDVVLPIVIALIVAAAGAYYLVRRNRPA